MTVVLSEFLVQLSAQGVCPSETQLRWAMKTGKLPRPRIDSAHRFDFNCDDVDRAVALFKSRETPAEVAHG